MDFSGVGHFVAVFAGRSHTQQRAHFTVCIAWENLLGACRTGVGVVCCRVCRQIAYAGIDAAIVRPIVHICMRACGFPRHQEVRCRVCGQIAYAAIGAAIMRPIVHIFACWFPGSRDSSREVCPHLCRQIAYMARRTVDCAFIANCIKASISAAFACPLHTRDTGFHLKVNDLSFSFSFLSESLLLAVLHSLTLHRTTGSPIASD